MGQKIDPRGFRLAVTKDWSSRWFANNQSFASNLEEDIKIREYLVKKFGRRAAIGRVVVERPAKSIKVTMFTARPGVISRYFLNCSIRITFVLPIFSKIERIGSVAENVPA